MKTRNGFVSNSSSSSFCIIGVATRPYLKRLADAEKLRFQWEDNCGATERARGCKHKIDKEEKYCKECGCPAYVEKEIEIEYDDLPYGVCEGNVIDFYGNGNYPFCAGVDALELLNKMTIPEAKECFCKLIKEKLNIDIAPSLVVFKYGEASSE